MTEHARPSLHAQDQCATGLAHAARQLHEEFDPLLDQRGRLPSPNHVSNPPSIRDAGDDHTVNTVSTVIPA